MKNTSFINFLGQGDGLPYNVSRFVKGSNKSIEDPLFLTFFMDFHPSVGDLHPEPLAFNSLLMDMLPEDSDITSNVDLSYSPTGFEISTLEYLQRAYNANAQVTYDTPADHLTAFHRILHKVFSSTPWYFQSISGVSDLWKKATNVTDANKQVVLTIGCNESVDMKILQMADFYRRAIYDQRAMSYRVPDNLRKFAFDLYLFEIRNLKEVYRYPESNESELSTSSYTSGLHYVKFKCKMCEFDFSETLQGGPAATDFKAYADEKPFTTSFKIIVDWVTEDSEYQPPYGVVVDPDWANLAQSASRPNNPYGEPTKKLPITEKPAQADNIYPQGEAAQRTATIGNTGRDPVENRQSSSNLGRAGRNENESNLGIFSGAATSLTNQFQQRLTNLARVPARIIGAVLNEIQTTVEGAVLGNAYDGRYNDIVSTRGVVDRIGGIYENQTRRAPVGPGSTDPIGTAGGYPG